MRWYKKQVTKGWGPGGVPSCIVCRVRVCHWEGFRLWGPFCLWDKGEQQVPVGGPEGGVWQLWRDVTTVRASEEAEFRLVRQQ